MYGSVIFKDGDAELQANLENPESALAYNDGQEHGTEKIIPEGTLFEAAGWFGDTIQIPNILYCPENIFANKIAMLDINFINPNKYTAVEENSSGGASPDATTASESLVTRKDGGTKSLREIISSWYQAFRNIAIVGLLIVLVYIGIRIMISSTSSDKAKYKENLQDWFIALCLVFFIHYIMSGILLVTESFTKLIDDSINSSIYVDATKAKENDMVADDPMQRVKFKTTITGYIRFMTQLDDTGDCVAYSIMYFALVIYTIMFTITYVKRFLYVAFFTMIAPLVALTYPLDKIRDGKAQAFSMWFKEYTMNVIIQPVHLLLYTVFVGSVMDLASNNPVYAIITMGFILPAEKFIKKLFGLDRAQTASGLGEIAGGALAMKGVSNLVGQFTGRGKKGKDGKDSGAQNNRIRERGIDPSITSNNLQDVLPEAYRNNQQQQPQNQQPNNQRRQHLNEENENDGNRRYQTLPDGTREELEDENDENRRYQTLPDGTREELENENDENRRYQTLPDGTREELENENVAPEIEQRNAQNNNEVPTENRQDEVPTQDGQGEAPTPEGEHGDAQTENNPPAVINPNNRPQRPEPEEEERRFTPLDGIKAVMGKKVRTIKRPFEKGNRLATAGKVARFTAKAAGTALGAATLGAVGAGAALTSGDLSKVGSLTAAGVTMGASAGNRFLGGGTIAAAGATGRMVQRDVETYRRATRSAEQYEREEQEKIDRDWKRDTKNYEYLRNHEMNDRQAKDWLDSERVARYRKETGISDIKTLHRTMKLVDKKHYSDEYGIHLAKMVNRTSAEFKESEVNNVRKNMQEQDGISKEAANKVINDMKYIKDIPIPTDNGIGGVQH